MSTGVTVYAVDFDLLRQAVGSRDDALLARVVSHLVDPQWAPAARELIHGSMPYTSDTEQLFFAYQALCEVLGRFVPSNSVSPTSHTFLGTAMDALDGCDLGVKLISLLYNGAPFPLPLPEEMPACGFWTREQVAAAHEALKRTEPQHDNPDLDAVIVEVGDWLEIANALKRGLVAFLT